MAANVNKNQKDQNIKSGTAKQGEKPIVLPLQRYNEIVNDATSDQKKARAEAEEKQKTIELLKKGNDELVAQFNSNMQRTEMQKMPQIQDTLDKKTEQAFIDYEPAKENEAIKLRERIAKTQQIMEHLKPGPRELCSDVLQSEVLQVRNVQQSINKEFERPIRMQDQENEKICNENCSDCLAEEQRFVERQISTVAYKKELLQTINENQKQWNEQRKPLITEQQAAREATDLSYKLKKPQTKNGKAIIEQKRATLREIALEAMKRLEQRRLRDRMVEEVEDRTEQLNVICNEQNKKVTDERERRIELEAKKLNDDEKAIATENECVRLDITTKQLQFTAEELENLGKDKVDKQARIEAYLKEMEQQKEIPPKIEEESILENSLKIEDNELQNAEIAEAAADPKNICTNQQLRYNMEELKEMNPFAAPTCH